MQIFVGSWLGLFDLVSLGITDGYTVNFTGLDDGLDDGAAL